MARYRIEVWDRKNTTRLGTFTTASKARTRQVLRGPEELTFQIAEDDPARAHLMRAAVLRLQEEGTLNFSLWRVTRRQPQLAQSGARARLVTAQAAWTDLGRGTVAQAHTGGRRLRRFGLLRRTPLEYLRDVVLPAHTPFGVGFTLGIVEPVEPLTLEFEHTSPLAAARMAEEALQAATGAGELRFRLAADGKSYAVDLLNRIGRTPAAAEIRYGRNLLALDVTEDDGDVATRIYATGGGILTLADAEWTVAAVGADGLVSFEGLHPVFENEAHVGNFFHVPGVGIWKIFASSAAAGTINVAGGAPPVGARGRLATDAQGTRLDYLESPAGVADYGVIDAYLAWEDVPDAHNRVPNADLSAIVAGLPAGVALVGNPVVSEEPSPLYAQKGGAAWRIRATQDGHGFLFGAVPVGPDPERPYTGIGAEVTPVSGKVRLELRHTGNGVSYPTSERKVSQTTGVYASLSSPVSDQPLPVGTARLAVVAHEGAAEWVLDAVMVTALLAGEVPAWVAGQGAHALWTRAVAELARRRRAPVEFAVRFVDLHAITGEGPPEQVDLGDDVRIADASVGVATVRVVDVTREPFLPGATQITVAPAGGDRLSDPLRIPRRGASHPGQSAYGGGPAPSRSRVAVRPRTFKASATLGTFRLEIEDPDEQVKEVRFFDTDGPGARTGPFPATRAAAGSYERDILRHVEHAVYVDAEIELRDGTVLRAASPAIDHDSNAQIDGAPSVTEDGVYANAVIRIDADTVAVWVEPWTGAAWGPAQAATLAPGQAFATYSGNRSTTEAKRFRTYAEGVGGVKNVAGAVEFFFSRYEPNTDTQYARCVVRQKAATATQITFEVLAVPASGTVKLTGVTAGLVRVSGPAVDVSAPSGQQWVYERPAELTAPGEAFFEASAAGHVSDTGLGIVPERGRDTVALTLHVERRPGTATHAVVRVRAFDPHPQGVNSIALTYAGTGVGALTPAGSQSLSPAASEDDVTAGRFVDVTIPLGAPGAAPGRVNFTATAPARVHGRDAIDVPSQREDPTQSRQPPIHGHFLLDDTGELGYTWTLAAQLGEGGTAPIQAQVQTASGALVQAWQNLPFDIVVPRNGRDRTEYTVRIRDGSGREAVPDTIWAHPVFPGVDPSGRVTEVYSPVTGTTVAGETIRDASGRATAGLNAAGMVQMGVLGTATLGGRMVSLVRDDARSGRENIGRLASDWVVNGGAQTGVDGDVATGWTPGAGAARVPLRIRKSPATAAVGDQVLAYEHDAQRSSFDTQPFTVEAGRVYMLRAVISVPSVGAAGAPAVVGLTTSAGSLQVIEAVAPFVSPDRLFVGVSTNGNVTRLPVRLKVRPTAAGTVTLYVNNGYAGTSWAHVHFDGVQFGPWDGEYETDRVDVGGNNWFPLTSGEFDSWDPDWTTLSGGVSVRWIQHTGLSGGDVHTVPGRTYTGLPGDTLIFIWYDSWSKDAGWTTDRSQAQSGHRVIIKPMYTAINQAGQPSGGGQPGAGEPGEGYRDPKLVE